MDFSICKVMWWGSLCLIPIVTNPDKANPVHVPEKFLVDSFMEIHDFSGDSDKRDLRDRIR